MTGRAEAKLLLLVEVSAVGICSGADVFKSAGLGPVALLVAACVAT
jgi:hypothetical protein